MIYMGSKNRIAKFLIPIMLEECEAKGITDWYELFVGGGNMIDKVPSTFNRVGVDYNPHTIAALIAIRDHVEFDLLPDSFTEEEYKNIKGSEPNPIKSWLRFVCSFGSKFDVGYARRQNSDCTTYVGQARRNAQKQSPNLQGIEFINASYSDFSYLENCLIYCDPPYEGTTSYKTKSFDHPAFWEWCRRMSSKNSVFISEYSAPHDFHPVWEYEVKTHFSNNNKKNTLIATEKLFKYCDLL